MCCDCSIHTLRQKCSCCSNAVQVKCFLMSRRECRHHARGRQCVQGHLILMNWLCFLNIRNCVLTPEHIWLRAGFLGYSWLGCACSVIGFWSLHKSDPVFGLNILWTDISHAWNPCAWIAVFSIHSRYCNVSIPMHACSGIYSLQVLDIFNKLLLAFSHACM